ncbi:GrpB family protein [Paenibacillus koleovorans]|uniref:GrpB family protein n=1 Tax=Paenibacillus koleovorans TaxID=121608 RepID=UPI000FD6CE8A
MPDPIVVVPYDPKWPVEFRTIGTAIRGALAELAVRIDHIGSTSVVGLDAKPVIDVQVAVESFDQCDPIVQRLAAIGYRYRADNPDLTKRYFREPPGAKRVHLHVREHGSWSEQTALLFRDYLRQHPEDCKRYAETKYSLMQQYQHEREHYVEAKDPIIWEILRRASGWSKMVGWRPGPSDA